ncbi:MAG: heat shock protein GrpE [Chloroflexi bacterium ADurb.Bin325]|nr:MAG: heat shock protein GrpE [Chloroflexi bacterium ADurb.Bin325]
MSETEQQANDAAQRGANDDGGAAAGTLQEQLTEAQRQAEQYLDQWRRATAELSNARKRMAREQEEFRAAAASRVIEKLLPIMDDIERAFSAAPEGQADADWLAGFRLIQRKLQGLLESEGVRPIPAEGELFDPTVHYAVTHEEADGFHEGQVIAEVARGYRLGDKVLRPSMVRVAKGPA